MSLGILHISDIHLKGSETEVEDWAARIKAAIQTRCSVLSAVLVVISGDIANSGSRQEYDRAMQFVESLFQHLREMRDIAILGPVIVPGNHDCDFKKEGDVRPEPLNSLAKRLGDLDPNGQTVEQIVNIQNEFFEFERKYSQTPRQRAGRLYYPQTFLHEKGSILVHCFNSAWVSRLKEQKGQIVFPEQIRPHPPDGLPSLVISVFHHPYWWFESTNGAKFRRLVENFSDVVLTGHEHDGDSYTRDSSGGEHLQYVEGAALQGANVETGFNFITVDEDAKTYEVLRFQKNKDLYEPLAPVIAPFVRNPRLLGQYFENNEKFRRELTRLGGTFTHPAKGQDLQINDLFVYPDLQTRNFIDKQDKMISSGNVLAFITKHKRINISGGALSGKTTLGQKFYLDLHEFSNYIPVRISGDDLRGNPKTVFSAAIDRAFREQYTSEQLEKFH